MRISFNDFMDRLNSSFKGQRIATLAMRTEPDLLAKSRQTKQPTLEVFPKGIHHFTSRSVFLGPDYTRMVQNQRDREVAVLVAEFEAEMRDKFPFFVKPTLSLDVDDFIAEKLFAGKGERDPKFPRFMARHVDSGQRYLCYALPVNTSTGKPYPSHESIYFDVATGRVLDFECDNLADYLKSLPGKSKSQGTEKPIIWRTLKVENLQRVSIKIGDESYWDIYHPAG